MPIRALDIINFWFNEIDPSQHWVKDEAFDALLRERFGDIHNAARQCELTQWRESPQGRLAEIIVLDQFSRNIFRDTPRAFAADPLALCLAQTAITQEADKALEPEQRCFLYLPFMHSESALIHEHALQLFRTTDEKMLGYEEQHKAIIDRFGRYPHRNAILGRESSAEEIAFLANEHSGF